MRSILASGLMALFMVTAFAGEQVVMHPDRSTPQLILNPDGDIQIGKSDHAVAYGYLTRHWERFGLSPFAENLSLAKVQSSLLGDHYHFQQMHNGLKVDRAEIIVSVSDEGDIFKVFNNTFPVEGDQGKLAEILMSELDAMEIGWYHLEGAGDFLKNPSADLMYIVREGRFELAYKVAMHLDEPYGDWELTVDAQEGKVLAERDLARYRNPKHHAPPNGNSVADFHAALARFEANQAAHLKTAGHAKKATGTGTVFDPDPRTTLNDSSLEDNSPASAFNNAYRTRTLMDITSDTNQTQFELKGPWIEVVDLESPNTPVVTSGDGVWDFRRGDKGFNDTMVYYHVDTIQRYIQSLGFSGANGIQEAAVRVDSDGQGGGDNSVFIPPNRLSFGAGCVDDAEDADVIIHEYGHAVQYGINTNHDFDADEGGMGEGFADYWAGSYSIAQENGYIFNPNWVFSWDGHNGCWNGRQLDKISALYDSSQNYCAHRCRDASGTAISNELWSTPLFQTLLELYNRGYPREEVDQIMLEGQFGLGDNLKMHVVAASKLQAARRLFPDGEHINVLEQAFARHEILPRPTSFRYMAAHVPPSRDSTSWMNEITLVNPYPDEATVTVTVFEDSGSVGAPNISVAETSTITLAGNASQVVVPGGTQQRWVLFESNQPLTGTSTFMRTPSAELGTEEATLPLFSATETSGSIVFPHVPADRTNFWSGAVVLNTNDSAVNLTIQLIGTNGSDLSNLLNSAVPTTLAARQKWVTFLTEGPGGVAGIFDDSNSTEKVSYVRITANNEIAGFQLYGYNSSTNRVATSGIMALPVRKQRFWPIRASLTGSDYTGFSVLNPTAQAGTVGVTVYGKDGSQLAEGSVNFAANQKILGLNLTNGGLTFPFAGGTPVVNVAQGDQVQAVVLTSDLPLRIFELAGDSANETIDGAALTGLTTRTVFPSPQGTLEIFKVGFSGTVTVTTTVGGNESSQSITLNPGASVSQAIPANAERVEIRGALFSASVIHRDQTAGSLTVINGKQVPALFKRSDVQANDDFGNSSAQATDLPLNTDLPGTLEYAGDRDFFKIVIEEASSLSLFTKGNTDTFGTLYDEQNQPIADNDDSGSGLNFRLEQTMQPGTYFLEVKGFGTNTGTYTVSSEM